MLFVTGCAFLFALVAGLGAHSAIGIAFIGLTILAHVAGNAIGTKLRTEGNRPLESRPAELKPVDSQLGTEHFAPATQLREHYPLGWPIAVVTALGIAGGGCLGGVCFRSWYGSEMTMINLCFGVGAAAVIGGIWMFACASLVRVFWSAWSQAAK